MDKYFKKRIVALDGYKPPPQEVMKAKLNQNESPYDLPHDFKEQVLQQVLSLSWNRYPRNEPLDLKQRLAEWHKVTPDQLLLGNGSNQLLQTIISATIEKGDGVLYFPPTFGLFELFTTIFSGENLEILAPPGQPFPLQETLAAIREKQPKLILLCSPNNPTGAELALSAVAEICAAAPGLVLLDEAYGEFSNRTAVPLLAEWPQLVISRTFSKAFSMAGLRLGYLISNEQNILQLRKANLPYNINLLTELIAERLLQHREVMLHQVGRIVLEREWFFSEMQKIEAINPFRSAANFILFQCPDGPRIFSSLKKQGILVRDVGSYPLLKNHLRVSVGLRQENASFLAALKQAVL